jgi:hypothetical protein
LLQPVVPHFHDFPALALVLSFVGDNGVVYLQLYEWSFIIFRSVAVYPKPLDAFEQENVRGVAADTVVVELAPAASATLHYLAVVLKV